MKRGAERQLSKDDYMEDEDVEVCPHSLVIMPARFVDCERQDASPGEGFKKADENVLAGRPYV